MEYECVLVVSITLFTDRQKIRRTLKNVVATLTSPCQLINRNILFTNLVAFPHSISNGTNVLKERFNVSV